MLMEKLNKIEGTVEENNAILKKIEESSSAPREAVVAEGSIFPRDKDTRPKNIFRVPEGSFASLDYFMSLPFVRPIFPNGEKLGPFLCDDFPSTRKERQPPKIEAAHIQPLVDRYLELIYPLHPIIEPPIVKRLAQELQENGLSWTGESAIMMVILAIGSSLDREMKNRLSGMIESNEDKEETLNYIDAAQMRWGYTVEKIDLLAIQAHYLMGLLAYGVN